MIWSAFAHVSLHVSSCITHMLSWHMHHWKVHMQAVSPDGSVLATGGRKGSLHLWQLKDNLDVDPARSHSQASILIEDAEVCFPLAGAVVMMRRERAQLSSLRLPG